MDLGETWYPELGGLLINLASNLHWNLLANGTPVSCVSWMYLVCVCVCLCVDWCG